MSYLIKKGVRRWRDVATRVKLQLDQLGGGRVGMNRYGASVGCALVT
ncbi:MAG TPA: hypothetical protein VLK85_10145 [Ramlibacter sp.]|nr:hypothetical protein [Ramlibacter sp.]